MESKVIVFLDDDPARAAIMHNRMTETDRNRTIWCTTVKETITTLRDYIGRLELVCLDHDLGGKHYVDSAREDCGMEVIRWVEKQPKSYLDQARKVKWSIHTWNLPAGKRMKERLQHLGFDVSYKPFGA